MSRTNKTMLRSSNHFDRNWKNPVSGRNYCTVCGHRQCGDPTTIDGNKAMAKSKGTHITGKRYMKNMYQDS